LVLRERNLQVLPWVETKLSDGPNLPEADRVREKGAQKALQLILANSSLNWVLLTPVFFARNLEGLPIIISL
jgi:hypothetical protein